MANQKISALTAIAGADVALDDLFAAVDTSATETKKITFAELLAAVLGSSAKTGSTVTASLPLINLTQTWNNAAVTFVADRINVTDMASASGSLLIQRQVGGVNKFTLDKAGNPVFGNGYEIDATYGLRKLSGSMNFSIGTTVTMGVSTAGIAIDQLLMGRATQDVRMTRSAPFTVSFRGSGGVANAISPGVQAVASLTAAATVGAGTLAFVSDATATTPRSTVAGGGANFVQVMSDGTNWLIVA